MHNSSSELSRLPTISRKVICGPGKMAGFTELEAQWSTFCRLREERYDIQYNAYHSDNSEDEDEQKPALESIYDKNHNPNCICLKFDSHQILLDYHQFHDK